MDKSYIFGAALAYLLFIAATAWLIMLGLGMMGINVPFLGTLILIVAARFLYVFVQGNIVNE